MAFTNPIANSIIKIWIKSKLPKIGLVKIENSKGSIATKMSPKGKVQNSAQTTKRNWMHMLAHNNMLFEEHCFNGPYLPHLNFEL